MFKKLLKNKKGFVLETAILFMLAIFSMCFLLSTLTITGHNRAKLEKIKIDNDILIDKIVEDYLLYISSVDVTKADAAESPAQNNADAGAPEISGGYPIVSLLENAENPSETQPPVYESFADYIEKKTDKEIYNAFIFDSKEDTLDAVTRSFTLTVRLQENVKVQVLEMKVTKTYTNDQTDTVINYVRKVQVAIDQ